ncbi:heavy metal translocating P-type ATPase [Sinorhizobium mexicanum]|uniref:Cadmium-translocating P-type ATPase n=1 Tax=Sinorhizobium mexicanum TaxID=375549 RepID=A0A859QD82_9HYPH|nr:heavy metal translocating P-type ATPase [Sinorhizobium mexicanum]MBP1887992.1 Cu2+-exporting ATPase [Sinorhizobium mexicanum]QLL60024.1 cadmium-translocating P-type ATPase [Sinorhizobium mexicanum]
MEIVNASPVTRADRGTEDGASELRLISRRQSKSGFRTELVVPSMHCGGCMLKVETSLARLPGVTSARANLSTKRVVVEWSQQGEAPALVETLDAIGFPAHAAEVPEEEHDGEFRAMLRALAVAAFASSNIMLLSFAVWFGADPQTRQLFHLISGVIALPTVLYSGQVFFRSAWTALRHGRTNMDVSISIGVTLTFVLSVYETAAHGAHAYFDAAVSLLFFLLIGRTFDHMMRARARSAVSGIARLASRGGYVIEADGRQRYYPLAEILPGMRLSLAAGQRVPVDATIVAGASEIDCSLTSGESIPVPAGIGHELQAGTLNLGAPIEIVALRRSDESFLAEMTRMMEAAESGRSGYRRIADRASALYAPVVHAAAFLTFLGWLVAGAGLHHAATTGIAVLIVTCPCALGLAVPMVQVVAAGRLFRGGILIKDGGALERLSEIDTVVFDKTGTLTRGQPELLPPDDVDDRDAMALAAGIARHSTHPYSRAIAAAFPDAATVSAALVGEVPGYGVEAGVGGGLYRLGRPQWAAPHVAVPEGASVVFSRDGALVRTFRFEDRLRSDAEDCVRRLKAEGLQVEMLSGDRQNAVAEIAKRLDIPFIAEATPAGKVGRLDALRSEGRRVLMVGDGLNDAAALAAAHVSFAPASASDIGRTAADLIFMHEGLLAVERAYGISRDSAALVRQNFALSIAYNVLAVPIAISGFLTPLLASVAMSSSSVIVVANALRLNRGRYEKAGLHG